MATLSPSAMAGTFFSTSPLNHKHKFLSKPSNQTRNPLAKSIINCENQDLQIQNLHRTTNRRSILLGLAGVGLYGGASMDVAAGDTAALPKVLGDGFRTKVARPKKSRSKREKREKEEVLEVTLQLGALDKFVKFDVYLNDESDHGPDRGETRPDVRYAGSYTRLPEPPNGRRRDRREAILKVPITEVIEDIGADDDEYVDVVFVARSGQEAITITNVLISYI